MLIIIGDWNAKVGNTAELNVIRKFGLEFRYKGRQLMYLQEDNNLSIVNTCFKQPIDDCIHGDHLMANIDTK